MTYIMFISSLTKLCFLGLASCISLLMSLVASTWHKLSL